jgi:hypothetical protein
VVVFHSDGGVGSGSGVLVFLFQTSCDWMFSLFDYVVFVSWVSCLCDYAVFVSWVGFSRLPLRRFLSVASLKVYGAPRLHP